MVITDSSYTITLLWIYLIIQVMLFIYTRLYQKRYNKNIGVCLVQIAFIVQLIVVTMFHRNQVLHKIKAANIDLDHLSILLAFSGLCSLLSITQFLVAIAKMIQLQKLVRRCLLCRLISCSKYDRSCSISGHAVWPDIPRIHPLERYVLRQSY
jgi:NADH:ubiquinone oxidoreductase subunit 4 (subunit M)